MTLKTIKANIATANNVFFGSLSYKDGKVVEVIKTDYYKPSEDTIIPSFVDLHIHGGAGVDLNNCNEDGVRKVLSFHATKGTCALLATTVTDSKENLEKIFKTLAKVYNNQKSNEAILLGIHLEGPYINEAKIGAQPPFVRKLDFKELEYLNSIVPIKVITLAPEMLESYSDIKKIANLGIKVQLGHSDATYEETLKAMESGVESFTHLYNAMTGLHHRKPGALGAAFAHAERAEIIADLLHVHEGAILASMRAIPNMYCVTDASSATGMEDGEYKLGSHTITKCPNGVRLKDGTLAGSCLTMDTAFKNLLKIGLSLKDAVKATSFVAGNYINNTEIVSLQENSLANFIVVDSKHDVKNIILKGETII